MLLHYVALHYSSGDDGESGQVNTLIIGAGDAGATIARELNGIISALVESLAL